MKSVLTPARGALIAAALVGAGITAEAQLRPALDVGEQATRRAEQVQQQINQLDDERSDLVREFRTLVQRKDAAELFARQQEKVVESQVREIASLTDQLERVDEITAVMVPMMLDMIEDLKVFIEADLPFKIDERRARITNLEQIMTRADVVPAEQYRLIIDAYQAELEVGNTIETWTEEVLVNDRPTDVDMFRYGRVSLTYLTRDGRKAARWNRETKGWEDLPGQYREDLKTAIRVARELAQPTILAGPFEKLLVSAPPAVEPPLLPEAEQEYRNALLQLQNEAIFADQQGLIIQSQEDEIASLQEQLATAADRALEMGPVLIRMVDDLEAFVEADLPYKLTERRERIQSLRAAIDRGEELALSERYRLIIQAYQDEMDAGTVQETWKDEVELEPGVLTEVTMYRYGRVALVNVAADRSSASRWDRETRSWVPVSGSARADILKAIKIAEGREQQTVLSAPVTKFSVQ
ncbi:MAG: DUF3450 domain-containing protein [Pseudomonadota bacterium]